MKKSCSTKFLATSYPKSFKLAMASLPSGVSCHPNSHWHLQQKEHEHDTIGGEIEAVKGSIALSHLMFKSWKRVLYCYRETALNLRERIVRQLTLSSSDQNCSWEVTCKFLFQRKTLCSWTSS